MDTDKNIYGLSEGVFKACQFLGLKFPSEAANNSQSVPSDYFGEDFELDEPIIKKLRAERKWSKEQFKKYYSAFARKFRSQKCFSKHIKTDLNIYFCDYSLFSRMQGASIADYFDLEFYRKSFEKRNTFRTTVRSQRTQIICNNITYRILLNHKSKTNKIFTDFLHRDWIDTSTCTFEEFKVFVEKHPRFFSKPLIGSFGKGAEIINVYSNENLEELLESLKSKRRLLEEIIIQHEALSAFCPDTVNTIRVYSILDTHNVVHILATNGRFGRIGTAVDNLHGGGIAVAIDSKTGIISSDAINEAHERMSKHPDTGKTFKGFQYPCWEEVCTVVKKMAKIMPQMHHIAWDITINNKNEVILVEANGNLPSIDLQQSADDVGKQYFYEPLLEEIKNYKWEQIKLLGWRGNNLPDFDYAYNTESRRDSRLKFAMTKLIPDCTSLMDLGCRKEKFVKSITPPHLSKYYPVDYKNYDDEEIIVCDFNKGEFPDIKVDTCLCAFTAEYVELLPQFLASMCNAAQKQILMLCRPMSEKEIISNYRWSHPFLTDFTEEFLIKTLEQNNFNLNAQYPLPENKSIIIYDFRRIETKDNSAQVSM